MITQKIKTNAAISYFFLGWIFLLARNNANFQDPFVKEHAKIATKGHALFLVGYIVYSHFLSTFFYQTIPFISMSIDRVIDLVVFTILTGFILFGAYRASKGEILSTTEQAILVDTNATIFTYDSATETERVMLFLSYVPFIGISIARKYNNIITTVGANISTLFIICYGLSIIFLGFNSFSMIFLFLYILLVVYLGVRFFFSNHCRLPGFFKYIPALDTLWSMMRVIPKYLIQIFLVSTGKKETLHLKLLFEEMQASDIRLQETMRTYFTDKNIAFSPYLIFLPFINLIFLPKLFLSRTTQYVMAIGQWLVITIISALFIVFSVPGDFNLLLAFPMLLGMIMISDNTFYRIPIIYELYSILNMATFGLLENTKKIRSQHTKEQSVSFKIQ